MTGSLGIKDDLVNAGAIWEDQPVVIDRHFVSSRMPDDLPDFCRGILQVLSCSAGCQPARTAIVMQAASLRNAGASLHEQQS